VSGWGARNGFLAAALAGCALAHTLRLRSAVTDDSFYTLLGGRTIVRDGLPHRDTWTVLAAGRRWVDQQWLAQLAQLADYGLWRAGGWALALLSVVAALVATFALAAAAARRLGASERSAALLVPVAYVVAAPNSALRAQTLAYVLFGALLYLLLADVVEPGRRRVFLAFPVLVLWANVHGSVLLGAAVVALRGLTELRARPVRGAVLALAPWPCVLASPYALDLPGYYHRLLLGSGFSQFVSEWGPSTVRSQPLFFALGAAGLFAVARSARRLGLYPTLLYVACLAAGAYAVRYVVWFAFVAAAVLPLCVDGLRPPAVVRGRLNGLLAGVAALAAAVVVAAFASHDEAWYVGTDRPAAAARAAATGTRVFATEETGDWLLFAQPNLVGRVALDARLELLRLGELRGLLAFVAYAGPRWSAIADGYDVLVLDTAEHRAQIRSLRDRGARVLFRDDSLTVLRRAAS
jgi:hypothetical protein